MTTPCWLDPTPSPRPALAGEVRADVVIIGGGLAGVSAAYTLSQAGVSVVLLEEGLIAGAATGRNAGFILQGTAERYDRAISLMGRERARAIHAWSLVNHDHMAAVIADEGIDCAYRRAGSLQLAGSPAEEAELIASAALLNEDGFEARLLSEAELDPIYPAAGFRMAVHLPRDGELHPAAFVRGAAQSAERKGARLFEGSPVRGFSAPGMGAVEVETPGGRVCAEVALVCVNARVGQLLPWFADKVDPVRGQMLATAPAPRIFELPIYADHGFDYWRQDALGRVVLGGWRNLDPGSEVGFDDVLHPGIQARMEAFIRRFAPLREVAITHRWSGIMGFSRDGLPMVGPAPGAPGALVAAGFTGHGFGFAWLAGEALATLVTEGQHPVSDTFSPRRFGA